MSIVSENPNAYFAWNVAMAVTGYALFCGYLHILTGLPLNAGVPFVFAKAVHWEFPSWFSYGLGTSLGITGAGIFFNPWAVRDVYGGAHLATENEIKELKLRGVEGLVLGRTVRKFLGIYFLCAYLRMNKPLSVLCFAPPESGKTAGLIIPSLMAIENSVIVMDPKGEIFDITAKHRFRAFDSQIIRFAPGESGSARWNPLSRRELPKTFEETHTYVGRLAEALIVPDKPGEEDMWTRDARAIFRFWALFLIWRDGHESDGEEGETSLGKIISEATGAGCEGGPQAAIAQAFDEYGGDPKKGAMPLAIQAEGKKFASMADKQFDGVFGTFSSKMDLFMSPVVADNLRSSDFCFKDLREKIVSVYFVVALKDMALMKPIISLFFQVATDVFLGHMPTPEEKSVTFFLDEFVQMGKMPKVLGMPAVGRGYRFNAVYIVQSFNQLVAVYGQHEADALKNTTSYHIVFAQNEQKVAKDISDSIGKYTRTRTTRSDGQILRKNSDTEEGIPLVKPQDIMSLPRGEILVLAQGHFETPIKAQAAFHFNDRTFTRCLKGRACTIRPDEGQAEERRFDDGTRLVPEFQKDWERDPKAKKPADYREEDQAEGDGGQAVDFEAMLLDDVGALDGSDMSGLAPFKTPAEKADFVIPTGIPGQEDLAQPTVPHAEPPTYAMAPHGNAGKADLASVYASLDAFQQGDFSGFNMHELNDDEPKEDAA